jgi:hypothetical protein
VQLRKAIAWALRGEARPLRLLVAVAWPLQGGRPLQLLVAITWPVGHPHPLQLVIVIAIARSLHAHPRLRLLTRMG